jgi:PRC-barrel domain
MNLTRLPHHHHPRPPHHELRQKSVFASDDYPIGQLENLYVDDDRNLHFVDVVMSGFLGLGKKHHLVPVEAIAEESPGAVTLTVDQQTVEMAPTLSNPHDAPDEDLQRAAREHCGLGAVSSGP